MNKFYKDERGAISILFVLTILIAVTIASGYMDIFFRQSMEDELQGMSDITAVSAVRKGIDEQEMRLERFCDDDGKSFAEDDIINYFRNKFEQQAKSLNRTKQVSFENIQVHCQESSSLGIAGTDNDGNKLTKDQIWLEVDTIITYKGGEARWDNVAVKSKKYVNFFTNEKGSIETSGIAEDGLKEIPIRSVARVVLR